ncbi:12415_t:CDS:2, partial [Acaulospora morrowiae]
MSVKTFTLEELRKYDGKSNPLYISIHGKVYDVTKFKEEHPGGEEVLMEEG